MLSTRNLLVFLVSFQLVAHRGICYVSCHFHPKIISTLICKLSSILQFLHLCFYMLAREKGSTRMVRYITCTLYIHMRILCTYAHTIILCERLILLFRFLVKFQGFIELKRKLSVHCVKTKCVGFMDH